MPRAESGWNGRPAAWVGARRGPMSDARAAGRGEWGQCASYDSYVVQFLGDGAPKGGGAGAAAHLWRRSRGPGYECYRCACIWRRVRCQRR